MTLSALLAFGGLERSSGGPSAARLTGWRRRALVGVMFDVPYGQSHFPTIRRKNLVYVDKSRYIHSLEVGGRAFAVYLRPRRFGKSTLLSMLEHYYDRNQEPHFQELFGDLDIGRAPTKERGSLLALRLEFTGINTDGTIDDLQQSVYAALRSALRSFCARNGGHVPELTALRDALPAHGYPAELVRSVFDVVQSAGQQIFLLIDEYDNFTNSLISRGREDIYLQLTHDGGFMRELYKSFKAATATGAIARIFLTGVSPLTLDDITSGANIFVNISQADDLSAMSGFTMPEVEGLLDRALRAGAYTLERAVVLEDMRTFYNGYRFSRRAPEAVYNPDMVLYFLMKLQAPNHYPDEILDNNVRIDYDRLRSLLFDPAGKARPDAIHAVRAALETGAIEARVRESFPLQRAYEGEFFPSLLYYLGMLTFPAPGGESFRVVVPNRVSRQLYLEAFAYLVADLAQVQMIGLPLEESIKAMAFRGEVAPFLSLLHDRVLRFLSRRDQIKLDERSVKFIALAYLGMADLFLPFSEMEHVGGFSDMLLPVNGRKYPDASYSWLVEFKYIKVADDKAGGKDAKGRRKAPARPSAAVNRALDEAEAQLARYLLDPRLLAFAGPKGWRSVAVVCVGTQALYFRQPEQQTRRVPD